MLNTSTVSDHITARTNPEAAQQRAEHLAALGCSSVLELCVGPSLITLERQYAQVGIRIVGNDIEQRWQQYYPQGQWIIGDALSISYADYDAVVFAPPLSRGCTGKRSDALMVEAVFPRYSDFLERAASSNNLVYVMVCPARSLATSQDRSQLHKLLNAIGNHQFKYDVIELKTVKRSIVKYVDIYFYR